MMAKLVRLREYDPLRINWIEADAADLLTYFEEKERDRFGEYRILTGYENTGRCFWCGDELPDNKRRWCKGRTGHWKLYYQHFEWSRARAWCLERYEHKCGNCGCKEKSLIETYQGILRTNLEVHHIVPLEGETRLWTPYNLPWNLICLCHDCHVLIHEAMKPDRPPKLTKYEIAIQAGQIEMILLEK